MRGVLASVVVLTIHLSSVLISSQTFSPSDMLILSGLFCSVRLNSMSCFLLFCICFLMSQIPASTRTEKTNMNMFFLCTGLFRKFSFSNSIEYKSGQQHQDYRQSNIDKLPFESLLSKLRSVKQSDFKFSASQGK